MQDEDIPQSVEIERDAFPTLSSPTPFRRELRNEKASYLVAERYDDVPEREPQADLGPAVPAANDRRSWGRLLEPARSLWLRRRSSWEPGQPYIAGFVGTWYTGEIAHVVSVGVRGPHRGNGIGELLLIGAIEQAMGRGAQAVTLEVRASNHVAKNLYLKYGFKQRGRRKGYYSDNREDAVIMTTDPIYLPPYADELSKLVQNHEERWGFAQRVLD